MWSVLKSERALLVVTCMLTLLKVYWILLWFFQIGGVVGEVDLIRSSKSRLLPLIPCSQISVPL